MQKKKWTNPEIELQQFTPNEYISICMDIACSNHVYIYVPFRIDLHDRCHNLNNQVIRGDETTGYYVVELRPQGEVNNGGTYLSEDEANRNFDPSRRIKTLSANQTVYWNNSYGLTYYHYGTAKAQDPNRPNHS